jgi:hypothetical protein
VGVPNGFDRKLKDFILGIPPALASGTELLLACSHYLAARDRTREAIR